MAYDSLKSLVRQYINTNAENEITGQILQNVLITMIDELGSEYSIEGIATPTTNPGSPSGKAMYFASQAGTYTYFDGDTLPLGIHLLVYNGTSWSHQTFFAVDATPTSGSNNFISSGAVFDALKKDGGAYDVTAHNNGATFASLQALLSDANLSTYIPTTVRKGGMSIKFVQTSDNKYVQYRLMATAWSTVVTDWQDESIANNGIFNVSTYNLTNGQPTVYTDLIDALGENGQNIPPKYRRGGLQICFLRLLQATYRVIKKTNLAAAPESGISISNNPNVDSGIYTADQLSNFASIPSGGIGDYLIYYMQTSVEPISYSSWTIIKKSNDTPKYDYWNLKTQNWSYNPNYWEGLVEKLSYGSKNPVTGGEIIDKIAYSHKKYTLESIYVDDGLSIGSKILYHEISNPSNNWNTFEVYVPKGSTLYMYNVSKSTSAHNIYITDLSKNVIQIIEKSGDVDTSDDYVYKAVQDCYVITSSGSGYCHICNTTPQNQDINKVYTSDNLSYPCYFRMLGFQVGHIIDFEKNMTAHEQYKSEIINIHKGSILKITNLSAIEACPYLVITDKNRRIIQLIDLPVSYTSYTCQEEGYAIFTMFHTANGCVTVENNADSFHEVDENFVEVDLKNEIKNINAYFESNSFVVGEKANIFGFTSVQNPSDILRCAVFYLKQGERILIDRRSSVYTTDNYSCFIVDANTFLCSSIMSLPQKISGDGICYDDYYAQNDSYLLVTARTDSTVVKVSEGVKILNLIDYPDNIEYLHELLKSNIVKQIEGNMWEPGYIDVSGNHVHTNSGNYLDSIFLKINSINNLIISGLKRVNNRGALDIAFYNSSFEFISGIGAVTEGYKTLIGGTVENITIPENAAYFRLTQKATNFIMDNKIFCQYEDYFVYRDIKLDACVPCYINTDGYISDHDGGTYRVSETLKCKPGSKLFFNFSLSRVNWAHQICIYDKNGLAIETINYYNGKYVTVPSNAEFLKICTPPVSVIYSPDDNKISCFSETVDAVVPMSQHHINNVLILGDSYSRQNRWINVLRNYVNINTVVNLARGSATLKDVFTDRTQYPYTSRPQSGDNSSARRQSNLNTFCCQLALLERLMAGTDLDRGETQLYTDPSTYPDVILIEGGKNDAVENDVTIGSYANIIRDRVPAYAKRNSETEAVRQNVSMVKGVDVVDRTTFIGAMYVLYKTLYTLFPNAVIIFISPSVLLYGNGDVINEPKKLDAINIASKILSVPVIDWTRFGRLSYVFDHIIEGDGTQENPYILNSPTELTTDMLHPNYKGASYLAKVVAGFIEFYVK